MSHATTEQPDEWHGRAHRDGRRRASPVRVRASDRDPRLLRVVVAGGLLLVLVVLAAVWWLGHQAVIQASGSAGAPRCEGTQVETVTVWDATFEEWAIPMTNGFVCTVTLKVTTHGDRAATIGTVAVPTGGPAGGEAFQVTHIGGEPVPLSGSGDAAVDLGAALEPGTPTLVDLRVVFREAGCTSSGTTVTVDATVGVDAGLASHALTVADLPRFLGTPDSSCDKPE